jgi:hypothetical protein
VSADHQDNCPKLESGGSGPWRVGSGSSRIVWPKEKRPQLSFRRREESSVKKGLAGIHVGWRRLPRDCVLTELARSQEPSVLHFVMCGPPYPPRRVVHERSHSRSMHNPFCLRTGVMWVNNGVATKASLTPGSTLPMGLLPGSLVKWSSRIVESSGPGQLGSVAS